MIDESIFTLSPNPRYFYVTQNARNAIAKTHLVITRNHGLTTIIGDVGAGKTSLLRLLFNEFDDAPDYEAALVVNPEQTTATAFLKAICTEFGVPTRRSKLETEAELRKYLIAKAQEGKRAVLFIDEAQKLRGAQFEQIRQLLNYETDEYKLLTIILAGQMEMHQSLADKSKRALVSRIFAPSNLDALTMEDMRGLIDWRCTVGQIPNPFEPEALSLIYDYSKGIPREVIKACAISIHFANLNGLDSIPADLVSEALQESIKPTPYAEPKKRKAKK